MITIEKTTALGSFCILHGIGTVLYQGTDHQANVFTHIEAQHIADLLNREPPPLDINAILHKDGKVPSFIRARQRVVWNLMLHLQAKGFVVWMVWDGESGSKTLLPPKDAMELLFNLDEASLRMVGKQYADALTIARNMPKDNATEIAARRNAIRKAKADCEQNEHGILLVLCNDAEDVLSDWNYTDGDPDSFNAAVGSFKAEDFV